LTGIGTIDLRADQITLTLNVTVTIAFTRCTWTAVTAIIIVADWMRANWWHKLFYVLNPLILLKLIHKFMSDVEINNNNFNSKLQ